jgi:uncharacterized membrane protein
VVYHAVYWNNTDRKLVDLSPGRGSGASSIDESGVIAGSVYYPNVGHRAVYWLPQPRQVRDPITAWSRWWWTA